MFRTTQITQIFGPRLSKTSFPFLHSRSRIRAFSSSNTHRPPHSSFSSPPRPRPKPAKDQISASRISPPLPPSADARGIDKPEAEAEAEAESEAIPRWQASGGNEISPHVKGDVDGEMEAEGEGRVGADEEATDESALKRNADGASGPDQEKEMKKKKTKEFLPSPTYHFPKVPLEEPYPCPFPVSILTLEELGQNSLRGGQATPITNDEKGDEKEAESEKEEGVSNNKMVKIEDENEGTIEQTCELRTADDDAENRNFNTWPGKRAYLEAVRRLWEEWERNSDPLRRKGKEKYGDDGR